MCEKMVQEPNTMQSRVTLALTLNRLLEIELEATNGTHCGHTSNSSSSWLLLVTLVEISKTALCGRRSHLTAALSERPGFALGLPEFLTMFLFCAFHQRCRTKTLNQPLPFLGSPLIQLAAAVNKVLMSSAAILLSRCFLTEASFFQDFCKDRGGKTFLLFFFLSASG